MRVRYEKEHSQVEFFGSHTTTMSGAVVFSYVKTSFYVSVLWYTIKDNHCVEFPFTNP